MIDSLPCPACGGASDLATWLDRAQAKLVTDACVRAFCARCEAEAHLSVRTGEAAIGTLSPAPAIFRPERRIRAPGLEVRARFDHTAVVLDKRSWRFEA